MEFVYVALIMILATGYILSIKNNRPKLRLRTVIQSH